MVIYANQSLRVAHLSMLKVLKEIKQANRLTDVTEKMSSMEDIFSLQEMYNVKKLEQDIDKELRKWGYVK